MGTDSDTQKKDTQNIGKKSFFLYPHSVIKEELISQIVENEFEIYLVHDHRKLVKLLEKYNNSIVFINIDETLGKEEWIEYVRNLLNNERIEGVEVGILTYNEDKELAQTYLMDIGVTGGYIQLKLGLRESLKIILKTLMVNEAKGKRKFVRAKIPPASNTQFNIEIFGKNQSGRIIDISTAGMACMFDSQLDIPVRTPLENLQLKLRGKIIMVSGLVAGRRVDDEERLVYVVIFNSYISSDAKKNISNFIYHTLQNEIRKELDSITVGE